MSFVSKTTILLKQSQDSLIKQEQNASALQKDVWNQLAAQGLNKNDYSAVTQIERTSNVAKLINVPSECGGSFENYTRVGMR
ncbi:unnamed protein product [Colias eurytheme]|nr:unnamed protein product [Colias eurytheme]